MKIQLCLQIVAERIVGAFYSLRKRCSWRIVNISLQFLLGVILIYWLTTAHQVDAAALFQRVSQIELHLVFAFGGTFLIAIMLGAFRFALFLPRTISLRYIFSIALLQHALLVIVPWRLGEISYPLLLRRDYHISIAHSSTIIFLVRITDLIIVLAVAVIGSRKLEIDLRWTLAIIGAIVFLLGLLFIITLRFVHGRLAAFIETAKSAVIMLANPLRLLIYVLFSLSLFLVTTFQSAIALHSVGLPISLPDVAFLNALTLLFALLPIHPPGGWGTADTFQIFVLKGLGYSSSVATPAILAAHSLYTVLVILGGITGWCLRRKTSKIQDVEVVSSLN